MNTKSTFTALSLSLLLLSASGCGLLLPGQIKVYVPKNNKTYLLEKGAGEIYTVSELVNTRSAYVESEEDVPSKTVFKEKSAPTKSVEKAEETKSKIEEKESKKELKKENPSEEPKKVEPKSKKVLEEAPVQPKATIQKTSEEAHSDDHSEKAVEAPIKEEKIVSEATLGDAIDDVHKESAKEDAKKEKERSKVEEASSSDAEITPKGDLVHYVTSSKESLQAITEWYTKDSSNIGKIARINQVAQNQKLSVGDVVVIPSYLVKNKKILP